jgi:transposase
LTPWLSKVRARVFQSRTVDRAKEPALQGRASKMIQQNVFVGIDVSKAALDLAVLDASARRRFANAPKGWRALLAWLRTLGPGAVIGLEPSGGYETGVIGALLGAGFDVRFADARRVRLLAQAHNAPAKTDAIDAHFIARFIAETGGRKLRLDPARHALAELMKARRDLMDAARRLTQQAEAMTHAPARRALERHVKKLLVEAKAVERQALAHVCATPDLAAAAALLQTAPGVGPIVAATLLAEMPELGALTGKQAARLAGLAPFVRESGQWKGRAACAGGRMVPRNLLYLAAMAAKRKEHAAKAFFDRLVAAGKPKMVALTALMRKLLTALNAMLRDQKPWAATAQT